MPMLSRKPKACLRSLVKVLWASTNQPTVHEHLQTSVSGRSGRELVLPAGTAHLVFRLDAPLLSYDSVTQREPSFVGHGILGGPRTHAYIRDLLPVNSVGAELYPGVLPLLFGDRADLFAYKHHLLSDLWGPSAERSRDELNSIKDPKKRLTRFEDMLSTRLLADRVIHPAIRQTLAMLANGVSVHEAALASGYGSRRFSTLFREAVGLAPKVYARLERFQKVLTKVHSEDIALVQIAQLGGYADQAHFSREFREFSGISPQAYRTISPAAERHVPLISK